MLLFSKQEMLSRKYSLDRNISILKASAKYQARVVGEKGTQAHHHEISEF